MKQVLKKILLSSAYKLAKNIYRLAVPIRKVEGLNLLSFQENEGVFNELGFNKESIIQILKEQGYSYDDGSLSWHYHVFTGWYDLCSRNNTKVKTMGLS